MWHRHSCLCELMFTLCYETFKAAVPLRNQISPGNRTMTVSYSWCSPLNYAAERRQDSIPASPGQRSNSHLHHQRNSTLEHSGILAGDPSVPLLVPKPTAVLEIQPSFPRNVKLPQIPMLPPPTNLERTCGTAQLSVDHSLFPDKACNRSCPDATGPGPASRHDSSSLQTERRSAHGNRPVCSATRKA